MSQPPSNVTKFPDMRPAAPPAPINLPAPSAYVQRVPLFPTTDASPRSRRFERKRLWLLFGIAVGFHAALLLGLWLMPALRIRWEPSPDAWVPVTSIPAAQPPRTAPETAGAAKPADESRAKTRRARPTVQPRPGPGPAAAP